jgi:hypothetical protein
MAAAKRDRKADIVRAAKLRAVVLAHLGAHPMPQTLADLAKAPAVAALKYPASQLHAMVSRMVANDLLVTRTTTAPSGKRMVAYLLPPSPLLGKHARQPGAVAALGAPYGGGTAIQIDVVKSTGRVRLQLAGLTIEIGVTP